MTNHSSAIKRLRVGLVTLAVLFFVGVAGYTISGMRLLDAIYMVVVTFSTVGNRGIANDNPPLAVFTILMIVFGVSTTLYIVGVFVQMMLEGEINRAIGQRRVTQDIERLSEHVIVCGYGRTGEILAGELAERKKPFVVVDNDPERINEAAQAGYLALTDDATEEQSLINAGIHRARTVVASLPSDAENVFITLTARNLKSDLQIIARGELQSTEKKLLQAGADRVVMPAITGAVRMAAMITRPSTVELIELAAGRHMAEVEIDELIIPAESVLVGQTVREVQPRAKHGLLIVAVKSTGNPLVFNPDADLVLRADDAVMVMGRITDIERFRTEYGLQVMLDQWLITVSAVISVFTVIAVGAAARWGGWLSEEADQSLMKIILGLLFPCLIFSSVSNNPALREVGNLAWATVVGAGGIGLGLIVGTFVLRLGPQFFGLETRGQQRTFVLSVAFFNYAFVPIPLIELLFDEATLGVMFVHNVGAGLLCYSLGIALMSEKPERDWWKQMLNGPTIATAVALVANWSGFGALMVERLVFLDQAVRWLGQASVPISLLAIGAVTADQFGPDGGGISRGNSTRMIVAACVLRLLILPALMLTAAAYLPISDLLCRVMVIMAAMPSATFSIILARHYGGVPGVALRVALSTSIVSLATIPLWIAIGMRVTGLGVGP